MITQYQLGQKIKDLRESLGFSQEEIAQKLDLSRVAISDIERGRRSVDALELSQLAGIFGISTDSLLRIEEPAKTFIKTRKQRASFKFNQNILRNLILYILEKCGGKPNVGETVLYKLLYFIDFDYFEMYGKPVTGMQYVKLQHGPVPYAAQYMKVIEMMKENSELTIITQSYYNKVQKRYIALTDSDIKVLIPFIATINDVLARLSDMNATHIEQYVHGDMPWKLSQDKDVIDYYLVYERTLPYARKDYDEMLYQATGNDILQEIGEVSAQEYDYYQNLS